MQHARFLYDDRLRVLRHVHDTSQEQAEIGPARARYVTLHSYLCPTKSLSLCYHTH